MWGLGIFSNVILGALAYFLKRSLSQMDRLEGRFNDLMRELPRGYVDKTAWQEVQRKLDHLTELLLRGGPHAA